MSKKVIGILGGTGYTAHSAFFISCDTLDYAEISCVINLYVFS